MHNEFLEHQLHIQSAISYKLILILKRCFVKLILLQLILRQIIIIQSGFKNSVGNRYIPVFIFYKAKHRSHINSCFIGAVRIHIAGEKYCLQHPVQLRVGVQLPYQGFKQGIFLLQKQAYCRIKAILSPSSFFRSIFRH